MDDLTFYCIVQIVSVEVMLPLVLEHTMFTVPQQKLHTTSEATVSISVGCIIQAGSQSCENTVDPVDFHQNIVFLCAVFYCHLNVTQLPRTRAV